MDPCVCMAESPGCPPKTVTLLTGYTPIQNQTVLKLEQYMRVTAKYTGEQLSPFMPLGWWTVYKIYMFNSFDLQRLILVFYR